MPHEGYADPITNDGPGFHSNVPVSELTERVTQAIKASDVSVAPLVAETMDGVTHKTQPTPIEPNGAQGFRTPNTSTRPRLRPAPNIRDSDSPGPSMRLTPRSATPTHPIPRQRPTPGPEVHLALSLGCARCLDP